jgi:HlyD family secretion protein
VKIATSKPAESSLKEAVPRAARWYRKRWVLWLIALCAGGLVLVGWRAVRGRGVVVVRPTRGPIVYKVVSTGRVMASARIQLGSIAIGKIARVNAGEGDEVKAGQVLVELVNDEQQAALAQAQASLLKARARVGQVKKVTQRSAQALVSESRSAYEQAVRQDERAKLLFSSGAASQQQLDEAKRVLDAALSRLQQAEISFESAGPGGSDFSLSSAGVLEAEAGLQAARARLEQMHIEAPADGVVLRRQVEPGDVVQPGRTLLILARTGTVELSVQADEKNMAALRIGQIAVASADALPEQSFDARVSFIAPAVDSERGTIEVRLTVAKPPVGLRPDMTVSVNIEVERRARAVTITEQALRDLNSNRPWVFLVRDGRAVRREVRVGIRGDGIVEVLQGLSESNQVIAQDGSTIDPGTRVRPLPIRASDAL